MGEARTAVLMQSRIRAWSVRGKRRRSETQMRLMALRCQAAWASRLQRVRLRLELEQRRQAAQVLHDSNTTVQ